MPSLPHMVFDSASSITDFLRGFVDEDSSLILVKNNLRIQGVDYAIHGDLILVLDHGQLGKLLDNLKKKE